METGLGHFVLKCLHKLLLYSVTLIHSEDSSHNWAHTSRLGTLPGEFFKDLSWSHAWPSICAVLEEGVVVVADVVVVTVAATAVVVVVLVAAVVVVLDSDLLKATAFADALVAVHAVLACLHQLLL